ncbi:hypothetical protein ACOME3_002368 [Neoechinorhynchus agilis]
MSPRYTVYYFDVEGRGEIIRMLLTVAGQPFEDIRFERNDWAEKYKSQMPLNKVPVLEVDGELLFETSSIVRYLGKKFGLAGQSDLDAARCDAAICVIDHHFAKFGEGYQVASPVERQRIIQEFFNDEVPKLLASLEKLEALFGKDGYMISAQLTYVDLYIYYFIRTLEAYTRHRVQADFVARNKRLVESVPALKEYFEKQMSMKDLWKVIEGFYPRSSE